MARQFLPSTAGSLNYRLTRDKRLVIDAVDDTHQAIYVCVYRELVQSAYYVIVFSYSNTVLVSALAIKKIALLLSP